jgi:hypothetical protein
MKANEEKAHVEPTPAALRPRLGERVYVRELPTPPEVAEAVELCSKTKGKWGETRQEMEDRFKLEYYYGGTVVAYVYTAQGIAVVATEDMTQEEYDACKAQVTPAERSKLRAAVPPVWNEARIGFLESVE